ncbi:Tip elongation aberrant protein 1 [Rhodotorula toruloides]|nr:Tip elongation aberrant protein 1 [Rhodotorula toruloides]
MAIFKSKHKKNEGSASNRADATGQSPPVGPGGFEPPLRDSGLKGSVGRSGIPIPSAGGGSGMYSSTGSNGYAPPIGGASIIPPPIGYSKPSHVGPPSSAQQAPQPGPQPSSSHTVLYPWSQRRVNLLPAQLLPPPSPADSPSVPLTPLLGPLSPLPFPRYGHSVNPVAAATPTGDLYIFGGLVQNSVRNDLYLVQANSSSNLASSAGKSNPYTPLNVGLIETRGEVPGPRVGHASVGVGNVLIVWGGDTKSRPEDKQDDGLYLLNLSTRDWTRVKTVGRAPEGRYGHAVAMVGSRFFVFGGQTDDGGFKNDLCWFDLQKLKQGQPSWSFIEYQPGQVVPPPRTGHTCVTFGDSLYIFGGTDGQYHYNDTWQFDLSTSTWTELACIGYIPVPREGHAATLVDDVMYVFGGRGVDGKDLDDLAAFKISNHRWFMFQNMGPAPTGRSGHAMATFQKKVLVIGGESYTSEKADDPSCVHVLDTTKIKYPPDSRPTPQSQATQQPASVPPAQPPSHPSPPTAYPSQLPTSPTAASTGIPVVKRKSSIPVASASGSNGPPPTADELRTRAASPTGSTKRDLKSSLGAAAGGAAAGGTAAAMLNGSNGPSTAPPQSAAAPQQNGRPTRPARPDDAEAFLAEHARSPTGSLRDREPRMRQASGGSATSGGPAASGASPSLGAGGMASLTGAFASPPSHPPHPSTPEQPASQANVPADAFYYRSPQQQQQSSSQVDEGAAREKDDKIAQLEKEKRWLVLEVQKAREHGFAAHDGGDGENEVLRDVGPGEETDNERRLKEALREMKRELATVKTSMAQQVAAVNDRFANSDRSRTAALQEASYYRAKLAALESGSPSDVAKLERDRTAELEKKLADAISARSALEAQVAKLEQDVSHHQTMRSSAEERHQAVLARANDAEQSHARVLGEFNGLQKQAHENDRSLADHIEKLAALQTTSRQLEGDNARLKEQVDTHESSIANWLATLEASEAALTAAQQRNDELSTLWDKATTELTQQQLRVAELEHQAEQLRIERDAALAKADDVERQHQSTRKAHDKVHALASGGLTQLLAAHRDGQAMRNVGSRNVDELPAAHADRLRAMEDQVASVQQLHFDAQSKHESLAAELAAAREREAGLTTQLSQLRMQLATVQAQHSHAMDDLGKQRSLVAQHESSARDISRARDAAEVKAGFLRSILADHGLAAPTADEIAARFPPMNGTESSEQLAQRVRELELEVESRQRQKQQLEERMREQEGEVSRLRDELDTSKGDVESEHKERADKTQEELVALQDRHKQLEATHLKAVQYVKGTEKMLRRMKEELTRYKERCEELESPQRQAELDGLRSQVHELRGLSESSSQETQELHQRLAALQAKYQQTVRQHEEQSHSKVSSLEAEVDKLHADLAKAQHDLEETLAVNASLNKELQSALKNPASPRIGSAAGFTGGSEDVARLHTELEQAQNKAEWLKRENASLEQRCRTAESKIAILLDHMEGVQSDHYEGSSNLDHDRSGEVDHHWQQDHLRQESSDAPSEYEAEQPQRRA